ncbi:ubiquitin carboxyl-hydrolase [Bacteroides caccae]|uniref:ubiquitin carboxyl-hydrolase n=1 Tax=Bacteroides caccae TaxID=47678 RepID=UPI003562FEB8
MPRIKVNCPACGTEMSIVEKENKTSKNNKRPIKEVVVKCKTADDKIAILRNAGIDVSNLFSIKSSNGDEAVGRLINGKFTVIPDNDPIFTDIINGGTVPNRRLFRRWVMAQVFHMMTQTDYNTHEKIGFTEALNRKGYKYQWKMVIEEYRVQSKLFSSDPENFTERNRWFNKEVAIEMAQHYIDQLKETIEKTRIRKCKGIPYVRLKKNNVFVENLQAKVYAPLEKALDRIKRANSASMLYNAVNKFYSEVKKTYISSDFPQSKKFKDAYKGAGAFFTMKNLILFHGCKFPKMNQKTSLAYLNNIITPVDFEGYKLFGVLKDFLKHNKIDIENKQAEWRR